MRDNSVVASELDVSEPEQLRPSLSVSRRVFTRSAGEEECSDCQLADGFVKIRRGVAVHSSQDRSSDCHLVFLTRVLISVSSVLA